MSFKIIKEEIDSFEWLKKNWEKRPAIIVVEILWAILFAVPILKKLNFDSDMIKGFIINPIGFWNVLILYVLTSIVIFAIWAFNRRIPKIPKDKTGIVFAISTSSLKVHEVIKEDFIRRIRKEIKTVHKGRYVIKVLSEYRSSLINKKHEEAGLNQEASKYLKRSNAKLLMYGLAQERFDDGEECYNLVLNAMISHPMIHKSTSSEIASDMRLALPEETTIFIKNELSGFRIVSSLYGVSAKLFIGIVDFISKDYRTAIEIHKQVLNDSKMRAVKTKLEKVILANIEKISKEFLIKESLDYVVTHFRKTFGFEGVADVMNFIGTVDPQNKKMALSRAIYHFLHGRNIKEALKEIDIAENTSDYTWAYSKAFLEGYIGNLDEGDKLGVSSFIITLILIVENIRATIDVVKNF